MHIVLAPMLHGAQLDGVHAGSVPGIIGISIRADTQTPLESLEGSQPLRDKTYCSPSCRYRETWIDGRQSVQRWLWRDDRIGAKVYWKMNDALPIGPQTLQV
jgi:hypothetical protein